MEQWMTVITEKQHLHVACAIVEKGGLVLAAQRSAVMSLALKWEFPGGKINPGESGKECLKRELMEEMGITVSIGQALPSHTHSYASFTVTLHPFICTMDQGEIILHEHAAITWLPSAELCRLDWAEADLPVIETYLRDFIHS